MDAQSPLDALIGNLGLIQDLGERLIHVKWSRETFGLLDQTARHTLQIVQDQSGYEPIAGLLARLTQQTGECLRSGQLPRGAERQRLLAVLDALAQSLPESGDTTTRTLRPGTGSPAQGNILLLAGAEAQPLMTELESSGLQLRLLDTLNEVRTVLAEALPTAVLVDMDFPEGALLAGLNMMAAPNDRIDAKVPLFFFSERSDLAARLEAISAGASGYFTKPVNVPFLLDTLNHQVLHEPAYGYRVLIVEDTLGEARKMAQALESKSVVTWVVDQPLEVLQVLHRFHPHLLLLDLDLRDVNGIELAMAIRQHEAFDSLPMIMVSSQANLGRHLAALGAGREDLLGKPVTADYLLSTVMYRLRRAQSLYQKLRQLSKQDTVSGLYNRRYFLDRLEQAIASSHKRLVALMLIALDNLRELEARDVTVADAVVEQAARRLQAALGPGQQVARFGDAIFAVLLTGGDEEALLTTVHEVYAALETDPYRAGREAGWRLRISIGVSIASAELHDCPALIQRADLACRLGRESVGERVHIHHPQSDRAVTATQQQRLLEEIRKALQQQRVGLMFQPIASLRGDTQARYEVFLRIRNQSGRELLPETVFSVAQHHRLGIVLERWVIANSIRLLRERQAHHQATTFFINLSPAILQDADLVDWLRSGFERTNVPPDNLVFEMAEEAIREHLPKAREFVNEIKALGCGFSLDRFGGREDSQALLDGLPVDYVKLDASFVQDLDNDSDKQQRLQKLVRELATAQITTVVGSIENVATLHILWTCGINYVQGFFLQKPQEEMNYDFSNSAL